MKNTVKLAACTLLLSACATMETDGPNAIAVMRPASGSQVHGEVKFTQVGARVRVNAEIAGLSPGLHGFHIHEKGDCSKPDGSSAGVLEREIGPLIPDEFGKAVATFTITGTSVSKNMGGLLGRGVIVQHGKDRVACGSIE